MILKKGNGSNLYSLFTFILLWRRGFGMKMKGWDLCIHTNAKEYRVIEAASAYHDVCLLFGLAF